MKMPLIEHLKNMSSSTESTAGMKSELPGKEQNLTGRSENANLANSAKECKNEDLDEEVTNDENSSIAVDLVPDFVFDNLPELLKKSCKIFVNKSERDVYLTGALTVLGGCFHNVYAYNCVDKKGISPNLFSFIIAPPASGKGVLRYAKKIVQHIKRTFANRAATKENESKPKLIIPANISNAGLIELLQQNEGVGIIIESEIDTLLNTSKQDWGDYTDILRNSFENESATLYRKTNKQYAEIENIKLALTISGTRYQFKNFMKSAENGLFSRGLYYHIENEEPVLQCFGRLNSETDIDDKFEEFAKTANECYCKLCAYESVKVNFTEAQLEKIQNVLQKEYDNIFDCTDIQPNLKRAFVVVQKIASILSCLFEFEQRKITADIKCLDTTLQTAIELTKTYLKHTYKVYEILPQNTTQGLNINQQRLLSELPNEFKRSEAVEIGKGLGISQKTVDNALSKFKEKQYILLMQYGKFKKR